MSEKELLSVRGLSIGFDMYRKGTKKEVLQVITDLHVTVNRGEIVAIVGSSGSGKSVLADAVLGLSPANAVIEGEICYKGEPLTEKRLKAYRGREIAYVPQSVLNLDPMMKVGKQVTGLYGKEEDRKRLFRKYNLKEEVKDCYPHQLSGGMTRRVLNIGAVINDAELIIADEPTPGLSEDQAEQLMKDFRSIASDGCGILLITHDINLAIEHADKIAVFYAGTTLETAPASDFRDGENLLRHPYSKALWRALPQNGFHSTPGIQPYAGTVKTGCVYAARCPLFSDECKGDIDTRSVRQGEVKCVHAT